MIKAQRRSIYLFQNLVLIILLCTPGGVHVLANERYFSNLLLETPSSFTNTNEDWIAKSNLEDIVEPIIPINSNPILLQSTDPEVFISRWDTTLTSYQSSNKSQISLPLEAEGNYNFTVEWGDGLSDTITQWNQSETTHTYLSQGEYTVTITGIAKGWSFNYVGDKHKIIEISQWGSLQFGNSENYFQGAENLVLTATDSPDLTETTSLAGAFVDAFSLGSTGSMNSWDVSNVKDMNMMFFGARTFNQPVSNWNVSSVIDMSLMFLGAQAFNQDISSWDVSSVENIDFMFSRAVMFNQDIGSWNVSSVTDMVFIFNHAHAFDQDIGNWDVSSVVDMSGLFSYALSFNQDLSRWDVSTVTNMKGMFSKAIEFNQDLSGWDVSSVSDMSGMFSDAESFNQDIGGWDVSAVSRMSSMFYRAHAFNHSVSNWDVSLVRSMQFMFYQAYSFNQDVGDWEVSSVTDMRGMFAYTPFNQDIGRWDVSSVEDMRGMLAYATKFDQSIAGWDVSKVEFMADMFVGATLSVENYNSLLNGWSLLELKNGVEFHAGYSQYSSRGSQARNYIIDTFGWQIQDGSSLGFLNSILSWILLLTGLAIVPIILVIWYRYRRLQS